MSTYGNLNIFECLASGERRRRELGVGGDEDDLGTVREPAGVLAESSELDHDLLKLVHQALVVGYWARDQQSDIDAQPSRVGR